MADGRDEPPGRREPPTASAGGSFAPFAFPAFRNVWTANVLSQVGSQIQAVAAGWLMTELTSAHTMVAAVQAASPLSMLLLSLFAGAVADNFDRRKVMLVARWFMLVVSAVLAVEAWLGNLTPWSLLAFSLLVGAGMTMQMPAWQASVRALVDAPVLPQAVSLNSVAFNLARTVGPALGGVVLAVAGVSAAFAINALSYVALIVVFSWWKPQVLPPERGPLLPSIRDGIVRFRATPALRRMLLRGAGYAAGAITVQALLPAVVRDSLHGSETDFGVLLGAFGVGSVAGALGAPRVRRAGGSEGAVTMATAFVAIALAGLALVGSVLAAAPFVFLAGAGWTMCMTTMNVGTQLRSTDDMLGRSMAIYQSITFGAAALSAWAWGALADLTDVRTALGLSAGYMVASGLLLRLTVPMPAPGEGVVVSRT